MSNDALASYAETLLKTDEPALDDGAMIALFKTARVSATPFAYGVDVTGEATMPLIENDPFRGAEAPRLLSDGDWVSLQEICVS